MDQCLTSFRIYETATRYYIFGFTQDESHFSVLKIDRTLDEKKFVFEEGETVYELAEMEAMLAALEAGNSASGGLHKLAACCGIIGMIRFTSNYYLSIITKRTAIALIGGHYVYHIDDTQLLPLTSTNTVRRQDRYADEARYLAMLNNLEIGKTFYFSNTYDITHTLQYNLSTPRTLANSFLSNFNEMFVWNHYLLQVAFAHLQGHAKWCVPIIHGFIDQAKLSVFGKSVFITLIARRSRHFAGARFLKRGANEKGHVANDVETEQIVSEQLTTPFYDASGRISDRYTSFVQHRGSIPLNWSQNADGVNPKPPIELNVVDPYFSAAALHFDDMFHRYGSPIIVINLVKARERTPRETILLKEFGEAIEYLNQFLPNEHKMRYIAWDMSRASKSHDQEVITTLETIAQDAMKDTSFFHSGQSPAHLQSGVSRTNCIDCLDRTNAAQFVIGKHALAKQLYALGLVTDMIEVKYDCDAVSMMTEMFHDHGDFIALQYGGSHLVNTMETYRKINQWHSHSRDMIESVRRFYNNSFLDAQRQDAINLFLGNFKVSDAPDAQNLWDMESDYRLHYSTSFNTKPRRDYKKWWTPAYLEKPKAASESVPVVPEDARYWQEYYKSQEMSSLNKLYANQMNNTIKYHTKTHEDDFDPSPFVVRTQFGPAPPRAQKIKAHSAPHRSKLSLHRWLGHASYEKASEVPEKTKPRKSGHHASPSVLVEEVEEVRPRSEIEVLVDTLTHASIDEAIYEKYHSVNLEESAQQEYELYCNPSEVSLSKHDLDMFQTYSSTIK